jgi:hypothetical protein
LLYVDVEFGEIPESKEITYAELLHHVEVELGKGKGKPIPVQAWTVPAGSRRLRIPDFKTIGT